MAYLEREKQRRVYYEDYGSGDQAVVLIHGWGASLRTWDYTLPMLCDAGHRVVLMDHRGCGGSDKDFSDFSIEAIASDVVALVSELGLTQVVLNGWSLGGAVVVQAAADLGARCSGVVLTCGASPTYIQKPDFPHGGDPSAMGETMAAMRANRPEFLWGLTQGVAATPLPEATLRWMWQIFMDSSPAAGASLAALEPLDQRQLIGTLACDILSCVGTGDVVVDPAIGRAVPQFNRRATVVEFEGCGHAPHIEAPDKYNAELMKFVSRTLG
jgi:pimeloyl-ACP methyl ester carboxylesterase